MGVHVRVRSEHGTSVVALEGPAEPELLARVGDVLKRMRTAADEPLVLDISDLTILHPPAVAALVANLGLAPGERIRIVCRRLSGRRLVRRGRGVTALVFATVAAAVADAARVAVDPIEVRGPASIIRDAAVPGDLLPG